MDTKITKSLNLLDKVIEFSNKHSLKAIFKSIFVTLIVCASVWIMSNPAVVVDYVTEYQKEQHDKAMRTRETATIKLHALCNDLLYRTDADRVWVIEFHNGKSNMANGMPFDFGIMTIEHTKDNVCSVQEEYRDFPVSYYPLIYKIYDEGFWYGKVDDLKPLDKKLYYKMKSNSTEYLACLELYADNKPLAILGVTYADTTNINLQQLGLEIRKAGMCATGYLIGE